MTGLLLSSRFAANYIDYSYFQCFTGGAESGTHKADHDYEPLVCILFMVLSHSIHLHVQYFHHTGSIIAMPIYAYSCGS